MIKQDRSDKLVELIEKNPGIKFREIMRATGLMNGVLSHHLGKLEKMGSVKVQRDTGLTRYYTLDISEDQSKIISALRQDTQRKIIHTLMVNKDGLEFNEIVKSIGKASSTVSLYLSQLVENKVVQIFLAERKRKYRIFDRNTVDKLIEEYHPGMLDKPINGFVDVFNSL